MSDGINRDFAFKRIHRGVEYILYPQREIMYHRAHISLSQERVEFFGIELTTQAANHDRKFDLEPPAVFKPFGLFVQIQGQPGNTLRRHAMVEILLDGGVLVRTALSIIPPRRSLVWAARQSLMPVSGYWSWPLAGEKFGHIDVTRETDFKVVLEPGSALLNGATYVTFFIPGMLLKQEVHGVDRK